MAGRWISFHSVISAFGFDVSSSKITPIFLPCRVDIRKGLNALKREIPGGDTFMHLGLQRVRLCCDAFFILFDTDNQTFL